MLKNDQCVVRVRKNLKLFQGLPPFIPYLSLFFILVLFFMLATMSVPVQGVRVTLPQAALTETTYVPRNFIVTVDSSGRFFFNDMPADSAEQLKSRIFDAKVAPGAELVFRCDASISMDTMIKLTEIAQELSLVPLFMTDRPKKTDKTSFVESER